MYVQVWLALAVAVGACSSGQKQPEEAAPPSPPAVSPADAGGPTPSVTCVKGGCSGTVCSPAGEEVMTTCEWREEYACYQDATCEVQPDGKCGWTMTDALTSCLASKRGAPAVQ